MSFQRILIAIEDSPLDASVFTAAIELAQSNKAMLKLVHCIGEEIVAEPISTMPFEPNLSPSLLMDNYQTQQIIIEQQTEEAQTILKRYSQEAMSHGVPTLSDYLVGEVGYQLCEAAKDWVADLIVVGRRGRSGLAEALLGSVSNYVVHHAPCSVLVIQEVEPEPPTEAVTGSSSAVISPDSSQEAV